MGSLDENFPEGLRVLIVHNNTTYLNLLKDLLEKCKYNVMATNEVRDALRMLKDNRNNFDIMITNDENVDMDGFKLLQLVNLEMNLPVVMLSSYNDTKIVMQWIRNGACDCLVKPVGIEELKNIWKHVFLRNNCIHQRLPNHPTCGNTPSDAPTNNSSKNMENNGKGIQESYGDDKSEDVNLVEGGHENNEAMTIRKKPRFHWSNELHQKFVDVVNQLGHNKAFPKRIAELMNVEGVTRDKVASHLQKYKNYLQKVDYEANKQGSKLGAELGLHTTSLGGGYRVYSCLAGKRMFGELNTTTKLSLEGLSSFPMVQPELNLLENQNNNLFLNYQNTFLSRPPATSIMLNGNQPLSGIEYGKPSSSLLPFSSTLGSSRISHQTNSFLQNEVSSIHYDPQDNFRGISSFNGSVQNLDGVSVPNDTFDNEGQHIRNNQNTNSVLNSFNISTLANSTVTTTTSPIVDGNIENQNNNNLMDASSSNNEVQKSNNQADLNYDGQLNDPKFLCRSGQRSYGYLEDVVKGYLK